MEELNDDDLSDISLSLETASSQDELFSVIPQELDFVGPVCDLDEIAFDLHRKSKDFHCQMDDITGSLLEKALRGNLFLDKRYTIYCLGLNVWDKRHFNFQFVSSLILLDHKEVLINPVWVATLIFTKTTTQSQCSE